MRRVFGIIAILVGLFLTGVVVTELRSPTPHESKPLPARPIMMLALTCVGVGWYWMTGRSKTLQADPALQRQDLGELICQCELPPPETVAPWKLYLCSFVGVPMGALMIVGTFPMMFGGRQGDLQGGAAGVAIGLIFLIGGAMAFRTARRRPERIHTNFHWTGVEIGSSDGTTAKVPYDRLTECALIVRPTMSLPQAEAPSSATRKTVAGNVAQIQDAFGRTAAPCVIVLNHPTCGMLLIPLLDPQMVESIAAAISTMRREPVLTTVL